MEQQTKKNILIGISVTAGIVLAVALIWFLIFMSQFGSYKDQAYRFTVKYPARWQKVISPKPGAAVVFVSPKENALDVFRENVNISVEDVPPEIATLKAFSDKIILQMTKVFNNMHVVESKKITFGGRPGYRVVFEAQKPDPIRILSVWTTRGGEQAYILTYIATARQYPTYLPLVEEMINSFELK